MRADVARDIDTALADDVAGMSVMTVADDAAVAAPVPAWRQTKGWWGRKSLASLVSTRMDGGGGEQEV